MKINESLLVGVDFTNGKDTGVLVAKIEELLKKSKFEWFMAYDPKEKAWTFQVKEK